MKIEIRSIRLAAISVAALILIAPIAPADDCPEPVGQWPYGPATSVAVDGTSAFYSSGLALVIADISEPASPQIVGEAILSERVSDIAVSDGYVYVANGPAGFRVIDVATPSMPVEVGSLDGGWDVERVSVSGGHAYIVGDR